MKYSPMRSGTMAGSIVALLLIPSAALAQFSIPDAIFTPAGQGPAFAMNLVVGFSGTDAARLQRYLNTHGCPVANTGPGSYQNETIYFGPRTKAALICFQKDTGVITPTGNLGELTRRYIRSLP